MNNNDKSIKKTLFQETREILEQNKKNKDEGRFNSIPFGVESLDRHTPGLMRGIVYSVVGASGMGKTQLTKFLFVLQTYKFVKQNPQLKIKLKIIYFALEESREEFMINLICNRLKEEYNITINALELRSMGNNTLPDSILEKVRLCEEYFNDFGDYIDIVDSIYNPYGLYDYCRKYSRENGVHYYRLLADKDPLNESLLSHEEVMNLPNNEKEKYCYYKYVPYDLDEFVIVITDHISLISTEEGSPTVHLAMSKWSTDYCRKIIAKRFNYCVVQVQQLEMVGDKQQFTHGGDSVVNKLLPSLDKLGDNKLIGRDYYIVLGIFAPVRYQIPTYLGYDITRLRDNFRTIHIVKNRLGTPDLALPMYFDGATNSFAELPPPSTDKMSRFYTGLEQYKNKVKNKN